MLQLRSYVHLNNAKLETRGILALFLGSCCRVHSGATALGLFKRLGKFTVVMRTGHASSISWRGVREPQSLSLCDHRVYGSILG